MICDHNGTPAIPDPNAQTLAGGARAPRTTEIRALTGIRGVAALFVVAYHLDLGQQNTGALQHILHHGYLSVDLFFVLSGFVMALTSRALLSGPPTLPAFRDFLGRRIARIYPLYLFSLLLYLVEQGFIIGPPIGSIAYWQKLLANLLLVQAWGVAVSINGVAWSISTEWLAYLLFPVLVWLALRGPAWRGLLVGLACTAIVAALCWAEALYFLHGTLSVQGPLDFADPTAFGPLVRCIAEFTAGLVTYRVYRSGVAARWAREPVAGLVVVAATFATLAIQGADFVFVALMPPLILVLATDLGPASWLFKTRLVHRLGVLSYGIYILHPLILWPWLDDVRLALIAHQVPLVRPMVIILAYALSLLAALLAYQFVEKPGRNRLRALL